MSKKVLVISSSLRSIVTITALISKGITDSSLKYHLSTARTNGGGQLLILLDCLKQIQGFGLVHVVGANQRQLVAGGICV